MWWQKKLDGEYFDGILAGNNGYIIGIWWDIPWNIVDKNWDSTGLERRYHGNIIYKGEYHGIYTIYMGKL